MNDELDVNEYLSNLTGELTIPDRIAKQGTIPISDQCPAAKHPADYPTEVKTSIFTMSSGDGANIQSIPKDDPRFIPNIELTEEQQLAHDHIISFVSDPLGDMFKLGGYAGTGKTTLIKSLLHGFRKVNGQDKLPLKVKVCAFTGKAVSVLARKGVHGETMHSLMYDFKETKNHEPIFEKKTHLLDSPDLVIIDEASMISKELFQDLRSFGTKLLFVGDPGQLEPVGDNPNLMAKPDFVLQKIHRQAELSPIIQLANSVRNGGAIIKGRNENGLVTRDKNLQVRDLIAVDQVICAKNTTRNGLNVKIRTAQGKPDKKLVLGDKIMILRNSKKFFVFNGLILFVEKILRENLMVWEIDAKDETGKEYRNLPIWKLPFSNPEEKVVQVPHGVAYADFGYCITCHKSQGSEWDKVLVYDEWLPPKVWDMKKWRYTAITRAAKELIYCI